MPDGSLLDLLPPASGRLEPAPRDEIIIDSFAGGGGASTGIWMALGRHPDVAINHDPEAVAMHAANHPTTRHYCQSVMAVDPREVAGGRPVGLLWASPDCKHFSKAKGGQPLDRNIRDLAWVVIHYAELVSPRVIMVENVEEFRTWGPLGSDGKPIKTQAGETFQKWVRALRRLGYRVEWREARASWWDAPTIRKRLLVIARRDGRPIVWPEPTRGAPSDPEVIAGRRKPHLTAAEHVIDWSLPMASIWSRPRPLAEATLRRVAHGLVRFAVEAERPFLVLCNHGGDGFRGQSVDEPMRTLTATRDAHGLVVPHVTLFRTGQLGHEVDQPLRTVTAGGTPQRAGSGITMGIAAAAIMSNNTNNVGAPVDSPLPTITTGPRNYLAAAWIPQHNTGLIGHDPRKPLSTIVGKGSTQGLAAAQLVKLRGTCRDGQALDEPAPTVTAGGGHVAVSAGLVKYFGAARDGQPVEEPLHTVSTKPRFALFGGAHAGPPMTEEERYGAWWVARFVEVYGPSRPLARAYPAEPVARPAWVEAAGAPITDVLLRMLEPRELFNAQGFPGDYVIDLDIDGRPLPKASQVRMCGNSVCPPFAAVHIAANVPELAATAPAEAAE